MLSETSSAPSSPPFSFNRFRQTTHIPFKSDWFSDPPLRSVEYEDLASIDWIHETAKSRFRKRNLLFAPGIRSRILLLFDSSHEWIVIVCTGLSVGVVAGSIDVVANFLADLKSGYCSTTFYLSRSFCCWELDGPCTDWHAWEDTSYVLAYLIYSLFAIVFVYIAAVLVSTFAPFARQSGIPEIKTILSGCVIRKFMSPMTLLVKATGLCFSVASGLWLGKEGPLVHVACCCGSIFMSLFPSLSKNEIKKREILSAASAAGMSVAFGAPIGGVLFSLEQVSYYFPDKTMWGSFVCAMLGAVSLQFMNPWRTGKLVLYQVIYDREWHNFEFPIFVLLGVIGGFFGAQLIKLNMKIANWRQRSLVSKWPKTEVLVLALITAIVGFPNVFMREQPSQVLSSLLHECRPSDTSIICTELASGFNITLLLLTSVLGTLLAAYTFGTTLPAGIILPSMTIGAYYGRALGILIRLIQQKYSGSWIFSSCLPDIPCVTPGVYAVVGAAGALGGVTRMTVSLVVIMFELTGALTFVLPIMASVMVSKWVGDIISPSGIYEAWIKFRKYPYLKADEYMNGDHVADVMTKVEDIVTIPASGLNIGQLDYILQRNEYDGIPIVNDAQELILLGWINTVELRFAIDQSSLPSETAAFFHPVQFAQGSEYLDLTPWMDHTPITISWRSSMQAAVRMFQKLGLRYLLFTEKGRLMGLMTKKDVIKHMDREDSSDEISANNFWMF
ncbi:H(+)/Cl(-) exchange transporter 3 [Neolecta irregularis DAH-3]|uniref:Chloride channel protein n=1 Tax=Neolecta irregularis (strain DAH-3) TaxID=1198029 RepID=A0A1U7LHS9_NEOID|nr:H(+)/Cl(-) exchange transporter 3 [Neolecta irregularis DAH-3]|eukprot:OLL22207.1 H(+)/Cl(-) exchange transporter 3 [Neolecta irregularis DAH-3]